MFTKKVLCCDITSFTGSIGAEHYYGKMIRRDKKKTFVDEYGNKNFEVQLKYPLTQKQATYLNKKDQNICSWIKHKVGDMSNRYDTVNEVREAAISFLKKNNLEKTFDFIIEGDGGCRPVYIIWSKDEKIKNELNNLYDKWDKSAITIERFRGASQEQLKEEVNNLNKWTKKAIQLGVCLSK